MPLLDELLFFLTFLATLGCGLMAGLFFAFSNFVMKALAQLRPESGIAAANHQHLGSQPIVYDRLPRYRRNLFAPRRLLVHALAKPRHCLPPGWKLALSHRQLCGNDDLQPAEEQCAGAC